MIKFFLYYSGLLFVTENIEGRFKELSLKGGIEAPRKIIKYQK